MRRPIFVGETDLNEAYRRVGHIIGGCSRLEESISYLEWQLAAFSWDADHPSSSSADRQAALRAERSTWDKYATLEARLTRVTKAFEAKHVAARVRRDAKVRSIRRKWETLREGARKCGRQRSLVGHSFLAYTAGTVIRQVGRPWNEQIPVSKSDDDTLITALGKLTREIGQMTTELGRLLPFADADQIHTD